MLFSFHGKGKDMDYQAQLTRFNDPAVNPNMIAVFPNGQVSNLGDGDRCWQCPNYCNTGITDKIFVSDLITWMKDHYCVDDSKIYASGKSVGGGFVDVLACSPGFGGNFAAFAINAGAMYNEADGSGCTPARKPLPILELHGTEDHTANHNGGSSHDQPLPKIRSLLQKWAERNGCMTGTAATSDVRGSNGVYKTHWIGRSGARTVVTGYNVTGQGHDWISTQRNDDNQGNVAPIDASTIMMAFFNSWTKP
jgi:poly(3-hydroxybutyrate) depolymerase